MVRKTKADYNRPPLNSDSFLLHLLRQKFYEVSWIMRMTHRTFEDVNAFAEKNGYSLDPKSNIYRPGLLIRRVLPKKEKKQAASAVPTTPVPGAPKTMPPAKPNFFRGKDKTDLLEAELGRQVALFQRFSQADLFRKYVQLAVRRTELQRGIAHEKESKSKEQHPSLPHIANLTQALQAINSLLSPETSLRVQKFEQETKRQVRSTIIPEDQSRLLSRSHNRGKRPQRTPPSTRPKRK